VENGGGWGERNNGKQLLVKKLGYKRHYFGVKGTFQLTDEKGLGV